MAQRGTVVTIHKASGSGWPRARPKQDDGHNGHSLAPLTNPVFNADHVLVAAEIGEVYVISQDRYTAHTTVWMHSPGLHDGFVKGRDNVEFRRTSKPFISSSNTLYVGGKKLPGQRPALYVWRGVNLFSNRESPRAVGTHWEYTVLAQSSTGRLLYCGCSDGAIEVWKHTDPNQPREYDHHLTGHGGEICALAVGKDGILISVDKRDRNIIRVWRDLQQVVKLDLKQQISRLACTMEGNLYVITRGIHPTRYWCNVKNLVDTAAAGGQVRRAEYGMEKFSKLQDPSIGPTAAYHAKSCFVAHGASRTVYFLSTTGSPWDTYVVEEWRGNEYVSKVDTGLKDFRSWAVSRNGTVYFSSKSTGQIFRWRLHRVQL